MERRIAALITVPLLSTAFLLACASLPAHAKSSATGNATANAASKTPEKKMDKVVLEGVRLLTPEKEIEANVDSADFTRLVHDINTAVEYIMVASPQATDLMVFAECRPDGKTMRVGFHAVPQEKLQSLLVKLQETLNAIENLKVKSGKIEFSIRYTINA